MAVSKGISPRRLALTLALGFVLELHSDAGHHDPGVRSGRSRIQA